jgi:hypothetical protein
VGLCLGVFGVRAGAAQEVKITVSSPAEVKIRIESLSPGSEWSFRNAYAGVLGLAERIEQFQAFAPDGKDLNARKIVPGEFRSERVATKIEYVVKLPPPQASGVAHVSWIAGDYGLLMLADLLPEWLPSLEVEFSLPDGWTAQSAYQADASRKFQVRQPEKTVFLIGRSLRKQTKRVESRGLNLVVNGAWPFKDEVVLNAASKVLERYRELTGFPLPAMPVVLLAPLPLATGEVKWRAETRGSTVVLLIDPRAKIETRAALGIIFTHELLHLWVPNSLLLEGDYDWFFEGFTLYMALITALDLKFINFDEYLATLARVYDSYLSHDDELSLIDASERRWTGGKSAVYDKGMLVAFLYDLHIAKQSGGGNRLNDRYRELFREHASKPADANEAIIQLLSSTVPTAALTKKYVEGSGRLELETALSSFGLRLDPSGRNTTLRIVKEVRGDQKQLLRSLGYR